VLEDEFAVADLVAVELKARLVGEQWLQKRLALDELKVRDVPSVEMQKIESLIDVGRRLGVGESRQGDRGVAAATRYMDGVMRSVLTSTTKKPRETCVLMAEKFGIPRHAPASRAAPKSIYKPRRGLNDISVLSKSRYGRSFSVGKTVNWRMSVQSSTP
jgi:hypothetical protein